jgi:hypothetical protein
MNIQIHQIYFRDSQIDKLAPEFIPYNNAGVADPLLEVGVFRSLHQSERTQDADLWGAVSWKFADKSGISASQWLDFIQANPGHDVYFCNPNPEIEALFENPWIQGESAHPHFLGVSYAVLKELGFAADYMLTPVKSKYVCTANYFVGSQAFWTAYMAFLQRVLDIIDGLPEKTRRILCEQDADPKRIHNGASYLPFFMERLFGVFLSENESKLSSLKLMFNYPPTEGGRHMENLRSTKDHAVETHSNELMRTWEGYRELAFNIKPATRSQAWFK